MRKDWLFFTGDMVEVWNAQESELISQLLNANVTVTLRLPSRQEARAAIEGNRDLTGSIEIEFDDKHTIVLRKVLLPYYGIFVTHRMDSNLPLIQLWNSWLGEALGVRCTRPIGLGKRKKIREWRVGLPGGNYAKLQEPIPGPEDQISKTKNTTLTVTDFQRKFLQTYPEWYPEELRNAVQPKTQWDTVLKSFADTQTVTEDNMSDQDDLEHRILLTFPVWLKYRLAQCVFKYIGDKKMDDDKLKNVAREIAHTLVPHGDSSHNHYECQNGLVFIEPKNLLDLAARLTRVKRLQMSRKAMEEIPETYRQNHPSFLGRLCPVESPESELVGLSLQLAQGATIDGCGRIHPADPSDYLANLGWGAGLIPFFPHNDGARNMMGAKNLRQAIPVIGQAEPSVKTGGEARLAEFMKPLADLKICPANNDGNFALGKDMLVAYLPWKGWNMEDAIVISQSAANALASCGQQKRFSKEVKVTVEIDSEYCGAGLENGLAPRDTVLHRGDLVAMLHSTQEDKNFPIIYQEDAPGKLLAIGLKRKQPYMDGKFEYEVELQIPVKVGDKLMGRHGNKGVVGKILPDDEMPKLPTVPDLGEFAGQPIQVLLNPHGVISRMNIGQLIETHLGWLLHRGHQQKEFLLRDDGLPCGYPAIDRLNHVKIQNLLKESGLDETGKIPLALPDGSLTMSPVMVGFEHIVRLAHIPMLKAQARRGGKGYGYDSVTGQAVHGRKRSGGQRLGEMEVWALAAYNANHILDEMLGLKASRSMQLPGQPAEGFFDLLKAWLRALMIDWTDTANGFQLSFVTTEDSENFIEKLGGKTKQVTSSNTLEERLILDFHCDKEDCEDSYYGSILQQVSVPKGPKTSSGKFSLQLPWLLTSLGFSVNGMRKNGDLEYAVELKRTGSDCPPVTATLSIVDFDPQNRKSFLQAELLFDDAQLLPNGVPRIIYCRADDKGFTKKDQHRPADVLLKKFEDKGLDIFNVVCHAHKSNPIKVIQGIMPREEIYQPAHGIYAPDIFGSLKKVSNDSWGYIQLPVAVNYPKLINDYIPHEIDIIPVLPLSYRLPTKQRDRKKSETDDELGYRNIIQCCQEYKNADSDAERDDAKKQLSYAVTELFEKLAKRLEGKAGFIRNKGLGRRVDRSARMVIAPNPELDWEEVGLSAPILWELMGDLVVRALKNNGLPISDAIRNKLWELPADDPRRGLLSGITEVSNDAWERLEKWNWQRNAHGQDRDLLETLLREYLEIYPDTLVLLNRQPSLHRYNFHAFHPVLLPRGIGDVIQLSPLACKDFAADFDGDEMVVHVPLSPDAKNDAQRLLPGNNLLSLATGEPTAHYDQDFVMGTYWLQKKGDPALLAQKFRKLLGDNDNKKPDEILRDLCNSRLDATTIISQWMRLAFDACTQIGVSFGFYDFWALKHNPGDNLDPNDCNDRLGKEIKQKLEKFLDGSGNSWITPGLHVAAMMVSGARGKPEQLRQILAARGCLEPGQLNDKRDSEAADTKKQFLFRRSLLDGLGLEEMFNAAMNARNSMCDKKLGTGYAGDITRKLVFALWPYVVQIADGTSIVQSMLDEKQLCKLAALFPGEEVPENFNMSDFPIGLLAAQFIGERGTQLSMQSFHTGTSACDIKWLRYLLAGKYSDGAKEIENEDDFVREFTKASSPYKKIRPAYFRLLWRVMRQSENKTLASAMKANDQLDALTGIAHQQQTKRLLVAAQTHAEFNHNSPISRVFFADFVTEQSEQE